MLKDPYEGFAERYDWMKGSNPAREQFFRQLFKKHKVSKMLDCACGTGVDLIMFHGMGVSVFGSDLSDAMLSQARKKISEVQVEIPLKQADFRDLSNHFEPEFDAVVCLTSAIDELLEETETLQAVTSMKSVLRPGGILVFDQGTTDAFIRNPHRFDLVVNNRNYTRFFVNDLEGDIQNIHVFDFIHTEELNDFQQTSVRIRIRLQDSWNSLLKDIGFNQIEFFGDWESTPYDKESSRRLIAVAQK